MIYAEVMIKSFLDLEVYQEAFQLMLEIEEVLKTYPASEKFLLTNQTRRAARAIPPLIAEGYARRESLKDFQKYLRECVGEANEMMSHLLLAKFPVVQGIKSSRIQDQKFPLPTSKILISTFP